MAKPNADDIHQAISAARELSDDETAQGRLARCFLYLHDRNLQLEDVYEHVENYLNSGMAEHEHARLLASLEHARAADQDREHADRDESLGL
ncbi:MAG TPA: hypothetical protein VLB10_06110 [Gammaproteobacteria bacterium]|jgi:hypothetical protein|nr:hypothetical protein [Gammaproteobacteria bacterium]